MTDNQKSLIDKMRLDGCGYVMIAKAIGVSENTVKSYCRRQKNTDRKEEIDRCAECGNPIDKSKRGSRRFCSDACRAKWWNKHPKAELLYKANCACCGQEILMRRQNERKYCSHRCYITARYRDGFQRLLADCRAGRVNMILTKSISRFARNTVTLLETVRELKAMEVDIFFEEQNIHTMSAEGELMLTILASYAQEESLSASENQTSKNRPAPRHSEFTGKIYCPHCGKNYKRNTSNGSVGWNCSTFLSQGKAYCHGKKIPETTLQAVCTDVLSIEDYNSSVFDSLIDRIEVPGDNHLRFFFKDDRIEERSWADRSRRESWTVEMKQAAAERTRQRRKNDAKGNNNSGDKE